MIISHEAIASLRQSWYYCDAMNSKRTVKKTSTRETIRLSFKPKAIVRELLKSLPERSRDVIIRRHGLGTSTKKMTLEAIGKQYGITRERVRQIENYSLSTIRKSEAYHDAEHVFDELAELIKGMGGIVAEDRFLKSVANDTSGRNFVHFLLVLGSQFVREKEDESFVHRWHIDDAWRRRVETALDTLYENLSDDDLVSEGEIVNKFLREVKDISKDYRDDEIVKHWLSISKRISKNPLNEYGKSSSGSVNLKGIRDYAYLVIRQHGSPLHFTEVAKRITELFGKEAHVATCHNELIRDKRFVLVGRGLYALSEWGYLTGVVKDVIQDILETNGPLTREEIIDRVLKERYVKGNTVVVNLQNSKHFRKMKDGRYTLTK